MNLITELTNNVLLGDNTFLRIDTLYLICALVGGIIMVLQFILMLLGFGGFDDMDVPSDVPSDLDAHADVDVTHGAFSLARYLSLRVVIAAMAFFGVVGLWANSANLSPQMGFISASFGGLVAGFCVAFIIGCINNLQSDGTMHTENAVGKTASVYVPIRQRRSNTGKIQLVLQGRTVELEAVTDGDDLPSGTPVIVLGIMDSQIAIVRKI